MVRVSVRVYYVCVFECIYYRCNTCISGGGSLTLEDPPAVLGFNRKLKP